MGSKYTRPSWMNPDLWKVLPEEAKRQIVTGKPMVEPPKKTGKAELPSFGIPPKIWKKYLQARKQAKAVEKVTKPIGEALEAEERFFETGINAIREYSRGLQQHALKVGEEAQKKGQPPVLGGVMLIPAVAVRAGAGIAEGLTTIARPKQWIEGVKSAWDLATSPKKRAEVISGFIQDPLALAEIPGSVVGGYIAGKLLGKLPVFKKTGKVVTQKQEILPAEIPITTQTVPPGAELLKPLPSTLPFGLKPPVSTAKGVTQSFVYVTKSAARKFFGSMDELGGRGGGFGVKIIKTPSGKDFAVVAKLAQHLGTKPSVNKLVSGLKVVEETTRAGKAVGPASAAFSGVVVTAVDLDTLRATFAKTDTKKLADTLASGGKETKSTIIRFTPQKKLRDVYRSVSREDRQFIIPDIEDPQTLHKLYKSLGKASFVEEVQQLKPRQKNHLVEVLAEEDDPYAKKLLRILAAEGVIEEEKKRLLKKPKFALVEAEKKPAAEKAEAKEKMEAVPSLPPTEPKPAETTRKVLIRRRKKEWLKKPTLLGRYKKLEFFEVTLRYPDKKREQFKVKAHSFREALSNVLRIRRRRIVPREAEVKHKGVGTQA